MVGADDATFAQLKPVLSAYCENVIHVGGPGHGHMLKLVNNFMAMAIATATAEACAACAKSGVSIKKLHEIISAGAVNSGIFQMTAGKMLESGDLSGLKFTLVNAMKDLRYYTHMVEALPSPAIVGEAVHQSLVNANMLGVRRQVRRLADRGAGKARRRQDRRALVRAEFKAGLRRMRAAPGSGMLGFIGDPTGEIEVMAAPSLWDNPLGTDGFEFVEYAAPDPAALGRLFEQMGFSAIAKHRSKNVLLYRQGDINFIVNAEPGSFAQGFARVHGPSICAMAFRVKDAAPRLREADRAGRVGRRGASGPMELNIPAIKGIGDSLIYLVDRYPVDGAGVSIYDIDFVPIAGAEQRPQGAGLVTIDHLTHNVHRGRMDEWASFYERLFNFREVRYFDIEGKLTGLKSKAMTSPCGKIRIPINESSDDKSQIQEYLVAYHGEGIQHIALGTGDIYDDRAYAAPARRGVPGHAGHLLRGARHAPARAPGRHRPPEAGAHPARRRAGEERNAAADLHHDRHRPDLLRDHPAQGQRGLRRRQFPCAVRVDRAGPDPPRRAKG